MKILAAHIAFGIPHMDLLFIWLTVYVLPFAGAYVVTGLLPRNRTLSSQLAIVHTALIISIGATLYEIHILGYVFPWHIDTFSIAVYLCSVLLAFSFIGVLGIWYGLSAFIQQATMLLISFLLISVFPLYVVIFLVMPVYVVAHFFRLKPTWGRMSVFVAWGTLSIVFFMLTKNIWLTAALHTLGGAYLIKRGFLYKPGLTLLSD